MATHNNNPLSVPNARRGQKSPGKPDLSAGGLVKLALPRLRLFHSMNLESYAQVWTKDDHWETYAIRSRQFGEWLMGMSYCVYKLPPSLSAVEMAKGTLAAQAKLEREREVHVRVAEGRSGEMLIDLGNKKWNAVRITPEGYSLQEVYYPIFWRPVGLKMLPDPIAGGSIDELRPFLNLRDEDQWILSVAWLLGALRDQGPYPICVLEGPHGSAKSTATRILRRIIDPNMSDIRAEPSSLRDLMIAANNSHVLAFDNLSYLPVWLADALCRLSTGGGFATRKLYSDAEEQIFQSTRPVLLNGIEMGVDRGDLLDRSISLSLSVIPDTQRQPEREFWEKFERALPRILGAVYKLMADGLRRLPTTFTPGLPRMADFARFVCAVEPSLGWPEGAFLRAYERNRAESNSVVLENSDLAEPICHLVEQGPWEGTATSLQFALATMDHGEGRQFAIPDTPKKIAAALRRLEPGLRKVGIFIDYKRTAGSDSKRIITIHRF
jgi:putative DNA primase/helicase